MIWKYKSSWWLEGGEAHVWGSRFDEEQDQSELQLAISPLAPFSFEWVSWTTCVHVQGKQAVLACNLEFQKYSLRLREVKRCEQKSCRHGWIVIGEHHMQGGFSQILQTLTHNCAGAGTYRWDPMLEKSWWGMTVWGRGENCKWMVALKIPKFPMWWCSEVFRLLVGPSELSQNVGAQALFK